MTDQLTALRELAVKVGEGEEFTLHHFDSRNLVTRAFGQGLARAKAYMAYENRSLDAAREVFEAALGEGWRWSIGSAVLTGGYLATVFNEDYSIVEVVVDASDGRALLLAIIEAFASKLELEA